MFAISICWLVGDFFFSILATIYCQTFSSVINMSQNSLYFLFLLVLYLHVGPHELLLLRRFWSCFVISLSPSEWPFYYLDWLISKIVWCTSFFKWLVLNELFLVKNLSSLGHPQWLSSKESACSVGDIGDVVSIPGRSPGGGNVFSEMYSLQYSCLGNPMDRSGLQSIGSQRVGRDWTCTLSSL